MLSLSELNEFSRGQTEREREKERERERGVGGWTQYQYIWAHTYSEV